MKLRKILAFLAATALGTVGAVAISTPAHADYCAWVAIKSKENGKYVSVEMNYTGSNYGMLRARADSIGGWERFLLCQYATVIIGAPIYFTTLKSAANGKFVAAEWGYSGLQNGMLRARSSSLGPWEKFQIDSGHNPCAFMTLTVMKYTSTEVNRTGIEYAMLRARSDVWGPWEKYEVVAA